jgi:hypothetical protein
MTVLLGLHGRKGAGKDAAFGFAREWAADRGLRAERRGFADYLKLSFARLFLPNVALEEAVIWCDELKTAKSNSKLEMEWSRGQVDDTTTTIQHRISGRVAMQRFGTESHRDVFGPDFWVDALLPFENWEGEFNRNPFLVEQTDICVVTDVRFENEAERIHALGGQVWKIDRPLKNVDQHVSEVPLDDEFIDRVIPNAGTLNDLCRAMKMALTDEYQMRFVEQEQL